MKGYWDAVGIESDGSEATAEGHSGAGLRKILGIESLRRSCLWMSSNLEAELSVRVLNAEAIARSGG